MGRILYNGIELSLSRMIVHEKRPIFDRGITYLWTKYTLEVEAIYNVAATSYAPSGQSGLNTTAGGGTLTTPNGPQQNPGFNPAPQAAGNLGAPALTGYPPFNAPGPPPAQFASPAPLTDIAIRHYLSQPRKQLIYAEGDYVMLVSPQLKPGQSATYSCDANGGPFPSVISIVEVKGNKMFRVRFRVVTYITEADMYSQPSVQTALLSHRWTMHHAMDQDFFTQRVIHGEAVFRLDRLLAIGATPDDFRRWLVFAIPRNFRRVRFEGHTTSEGNRYVYTVVDKESAFNIAAFGSGSQNVTRIEGYYTGAIRSQGLERTFINIIKADSIGGKIEAVVDVVPRMHNHLVVRVWGNRNATRQQLASVATAVMQTRITQLGLLFNEVNLSVTEDIAGKFVEARLDVFMGPIASALSGTLVSLTDSKGTVMGSGIPIANDDTTGALAGSLGFSPLPPGDNVSRGTYIGSIHSAVPTDAGTVPAQPQDVPNYTPRSPGSGV